MTASSCDLTLVIDIGKSHAKLLMVDDAGMVVERHGRNNASVMSPLAYPALDVHGLEDWMHATLRASAHAMRCGRVITSTHGAAMVALADEGLAWEPLDYEYDAVAASDTLRTAFAAASEGFAHTLSPELPAGLNAARQLFWLQHTHPQAWHRTRCLLPYPQYWAWLLSGVAATEVSSLGCHTHMWHPQAGTYSALAVAQGWAALLPPLRAAWEVLGPLRPELAQRWGLPASCQVHVGVHDSNACLARYLGPQAPDPRPGPATDEALTVVSSGTWTVLMAPGAPTAALQASCDMLGNVDVLGRATPTARFMGGREFAALLDGAPPDAGSLADVQALLASHTLALPSFAREGGPFRGREGGVTRAGQPLAGALSQHLAPGARAALAALYCAQVTAFLVERLWAGVTPQTRTLVVEGPLAHNAVYLSVLQALLPTHTCRWSHDTLEGTARGAWLLAHWPAQAGHSYLQAPQPCALPGLSDYHAQWLSAAVADA